MGWERQGGGGEGRGRIFPDCGARLALQPHWDLAPGECHDQTMLSFQIPLWSWGVGSAALKSQGPVVGRPLNKPNPSGNEGRESGGDGWQW